MKKYRMAVCALFVGFSLGILWMQAVPDSMWKVSGLSDLFLLRSYVSAPFSEMDYTKKLMLERGAFFILCALSGITVFGMPVSLLVTGGLGLFAGAVLSASLISGGLKGFFLGICLFLPHGLLALPVSLLFTAECFRMSRRSLKNRFFDVADYKAYFGRMLLLLAFWLLAAWLEAFVNPVLVRFFFEKTVF